MSRALWLAGAVALALAGCGGDDGGDASAGAGAGGAGAAASAGASGSAGAGGSDATFSAVFDAIIRGTGCNGGGACHGGATSITTLTMRLKDQAHMQLVGVPAMSMTLSGMGPQCVNSGLVRVVAGDPDNSLLVQKLENTQTCGDPMPPTTALLSAEQIDLVRRWIARGAPND
jgi:hypothetical protein